MDYLEALQVVLPQLVLHDILDIIWPILPGGVLDYLKFI